MGAVACLNAATAVPQSTQTLPGGASQIQEMHGDWRVICVQKNEQKLCSLSQQQTDQNSRQLVLGVELRPGPADKVEGTFVLPFGLAVDKPVSFQIDNGPLLNLYFKTCLPVGCIVPANFDAPMVSALRAGAEATLRPVGADSGQEAALKVSLKGFSSALARTAALAK